MTEPAKSETPVEQRPIGWDFPTKRSPVLPFPGSIGLIGCGKISEHHLRAYRDLGYPVSVLCDKHPVKLVQRSRPFYPEARLVEDHRELLADPEVTIVDLATHTNVRPALVREALLAGKHVLSQKPFVENLTEGQELVDLAKQQNCLLAVNQNARWAPHFCFMRHAVAAGRLGQLSAVRFSIQWDHTWTRGTPFEEMHHLLLNDFAIHWFDLIQCFFRGRPWQTVHASLRCSATQNMKPPMLAHVTIDFGDAQASLTLDAATPFLPMNQTYLAGSEASIHSVGPDYSEQTITVADANGQAIIPYSGGWFPDGFGGAMSELADAIQMGRQPVNHAADNLKSLELCYAAMASADQGRVIEAGEIL